MRKTRLDVLRGMREILRDKKKWGKGDDYYRGKFCLRGAFCQMKYGVAHAYEVKDQVKFQKDYKTFSKLMGLAGGKGMVGFNDCHNTSHKKVLKAIQHGIDKVKRELKKRRNRG